MATSHLIFNNFLYIFWYILHHKVQFIILYCARYLMQTDILNVSIQMPDSVMQRYCIGALDKPGTVFDTDIFVNCNWVDTWWQ